MINDYLSMIKRGKEVSWTTPDARSFTKWVGFDKAYPTGKIPSVIATLEIPDNYIHTIFVTVRNITETGFTYVVYNASNGSLSIPVNWIAFA